MIEAAPAHCGSARWVKERRDRLDSLVTGTWSAPKTGGCVRSNVFGVVYSAAF
jgi:hypothetical protein